MTTDYGKDAILAQKGKLEERRRLAASMTTKPEILYYMAKDGDPDVRKALAANPATPNQADMILAKDPDEGVRASLTQKIAQMMPDLTEKQTTKVRAWAADTLEDMAREERTRGLAFATGSVLVVGLIGVLITVQIQKARLIQKQIER